MLSEHGFTLVEALAAVGLIGLAVFAATSLTAVHPVVSERLEAQYDMLRALDAVLEGVRSGVIPAISGPVDVPIPVREDVTIQLEVSQTEIRGLQRISATAGCVVRGREISRSLHTAVWSTQ